jgi:hypothetical protein
MNLHEQVSTPLIQGISEKDVPELGKDNILLNVIIRLQRFSNSCGWKECWRLKKLEGARESSLSPKSFNCKGFFESEAIVKAKRERLNLNLKAKKRTKRVCQEALRIWRLFCWLWKRKLWSEDVKAVLELFIQIQCLDGMVHSVLRHDVRMKRMSTVVRSP